MMPLPRALLAWASLIAQSQRADNSLTRAGTLLDYTRLRPWGEGSLALAYPSEWDAELPVSEGEAFWAAVGIVLEPPRLRGKAQKIGQLHGSTANPLLNELQQCLLPMSAGNYSGPQSELKLYSDITDLSLSGGIEPRFTDLEGPRTLRPVGVTVEFSLRDLRSGEERAAMVCAESIGVGRLGTSDCYELACLDAGRCAIRLAVERFQFVMGQANLSCYGVSHAHVR